MESTEVIELRRSNEIDRCNVDCRNSIVIKLAAHREYLRAFLNEKEMSIEYFELLLTKIISNILDGCSLDPDHIIKDLPLNLALEDEKMKVARKKVLNLYSDIFNGMSSRYLSRSGSFLFEKLF